MKIGFKKIIKYVDFKHIILALIHVTFIGTFVWLVDFKYPETVWIQNIIWPIGNSLPILSVIYVAFVIVGNIYKLMEKKEVLK